MTVGRRLLFTKWRHGILFSVLFSLSLSLYGKDPKSAACLLNQLSLLENLRTGHLAVRPEKLSGLIAEKHKELKGLDYEGIIPWGPKKRDMAKRFLVEKFGIEKFTQELPVYDPNQKLGKATVSIHDILFSQVNARNLSQDGKYTVIANAKAFKDGTLKLEKLPAMRVWRDKQGRIWTLDHRRLAAMRLSGAVDDVVVEFVDEATVQAQKFKYGTHNDGHSLFVWLDDRPQGEDLAIVLVNKKSPPPVQVQPKFELLKNPLLKDNLESGHIASMKEFTPLISKVEASLTHLDHRGVIPWGPKSRDVVKRYFIEKFNMGFMAETLPTYDKKQKLGKMEVNVKDILFSQIRCRNTSQDGKYTVLGNAKAFQEGKLKVSDLPTLKVWRDTEGRIWTLDHRRIAAIRLSGVIERIQVEFVAEEIVKAQKFKFDTMNGGKSLFVWLDDAKKETELSVVIAPEKMSRSQAGGK